MSVSQVGGCGSCFRANCEAQLYSFWDFLPSLSVTSLGSVAQNSVWLVLSPLFGSFDRCPLLASLSHGARTDLGPRHINCPILTTVCDMEDRKGWLGRQQEVLPRL